MTQLPPIAADLLEVATYVYAADQMVTRGGRKEFEYGTKWRRRFRFEIPVRCPAIWKRPEVLTALIGVLDFLVDDDYEFGFSAHPNPNPIGSYITDELGFDSPTDWEEVMLFSGGLDSHAGADLEILQAHKKVVLVSHRPVSKVYSRQRDLSQALSDRVIPPGRRPLHVAVEINKGKPLGREFTQRSRSFLFAALAAITARTFGLRRVRFYENGVTSLNLPPSPQVLGGRASRTTHPRTLIGFEKLFSELFQTAIEVDNPFRWKTKATILRELKATGRADLCAQTVSCAHTWEQTTSHPHCGRCSQCVDRRLTVLAAGLTDLEDVPGRYRHDVLCEERTGADLILAERYVGMVRQVDRMTGPEQFLTTFPEVADVLPYTKLPLYEGVKLTFDMYKKHAQEILDGIATAVTRLSKPYVRGQFPVGSLLAVAGVQGQNASPQVARFDLPSLSRQAASGLRIDHDRFTVWWQGRRCELRATLEFQLFCRLVQTPGAFVAIQTLANDVWGDDMTEKLAVQRVASNLRRKLQDAEWVGVDVDGTTNRGHYAITGIEGPVLSLPSSSAENQS